MTPVESPEDASETIFRAPFNAPRSHHSSSGSRGPTANVQSLELLTN